MTEATAPLVSVVIPTKGRPHLLGRAINSVLAQSYSNFEVVVIVDGADEETEGLLEGYSDPRLRYVVQTQAGHVQARNTGVKESHGTWVAFLDDDDEWFPAKLGTQLAMLQQHREEGSAVCFTRLVGRSQVRDHVWPTRGPLEGEPLGNYLFCRHGFFTGEGLILISTLMAPRELLIDLPFKLSESIHDDWDWFLRAEAENVRFLFCPEPLVIWNLDENRPRVTNTTRWRQSFEWALRHKRVMTSEAYASFLLIVVPGYAAGWRDIAAWTTAWREAWRSGRRPRTQDLLISLGILLLPRQLRSRLRSLQRLRRPRFTSARQVSA